MKIAYIIPGSGGSFYCENCMRDAGIASALMAQGLEISTIPMYLPLFKMSGPDTQPLFYGAVELFLREQYRAFKKIPGWLKRLLNSRPVLALAAGLAGSTRAKGLADLTISMLEAENGKSGDELDRLAGFLADVVKPDVIHLSNALLLGMGSRIRQQTGIPVVSSLQDEHVWMEPMNKEAAQACWSIMREKASGIDRFVAVSDYYRTFMADHLGISADKIEVVPPGIDPEVYRECRRLRKPPPEGLTIGFLSRFDSASGLDLLIEAVAILKNKHNIDGIRILADGGMTGDDTPYFSRVKKLARSSGLDKAISIRTSYHREHRFDLLARSDVLCVPRTTPEAFGMFLLEAFACGIPVVMPDIGAFPEIVNNGGAAAGLLFPAADPVALAAALHRVYSDRTLAGTMGNAGLAAANTRFDLRKVAERLAEIYRQLRS